jgi:hypothetical protein
MQGVFSFWNALLTKYGYAKGISAETGRAIRIKNDNKQRRTWAYSFSSIKIVKMYQLHELKDGNYWETMNKLK